MSKTPSTSLINIEILQGFKSARAATGAAVIIDVFRAFSVEAYCYRNSQIQKLRLLK